MTDDQRRRLLEGARSLRIDLDASHVESVGYLLERLEAANSRVNLTRVDPVDVIPLLVLDSLTVSRAARLAAGTRLLDIGTGAGFPGLPLRIACPGLDATLLDATRKKLDFIDEAIEALELADVRTLHARAEEAAHDARWRGRFDVVTAKAVARLDVLVEYMLPFVAVGGVAVAMKGREIREELESARPLIEELGARVREVVELTIPTTDIERRLVVLEKAEPTPKRYPRENRVIRRALRT